MAKREIAKVQDDLVLTIKNHHFECCGTPPDVKADVGDGHYTGYYENNGNEQLVFRYDYESKCGTVWHGDHSWKKPVTIKGTSPQGIIFDKDEMVWLRLCWETATGEKLEKSLTESIFGG